MTETPDEVAGVDDSPEDEEYAESGQALRRTLMAIIAVAVLVLAGSTGWLLRGGGSSGASVPAANSVDAGFAQDMAVHHIQAITMAGYERDNTSSPQMKVLAFDIESSQQFQVGEMSGWLDVWGLSRNDPTPMAWMGAEHAADVVNGLMPGMATPAQMNRLETLHGKALDVFFLQLMIHHHQGGLPMAQYAAVHAAEPYVRQLAGAMVSAQSAEIIEMEQLLRQLGASPLPAPED
ncbi:MAG: DUF305 domain-containing protein [Actinobacteria bacterium]|nr:DUF305 domain-containing protein [Actinomycetota bacterium]